MKLCLVSKYLNIFRTMKVSLVAVGAHLPYQQSSCIGPGPRSSSSLELEVSCAEDGTGGPGAGALCLCRDYHCSPLDYIASFA